MAYANRLRYHNVPPSLRAVLSLAWLSLVFALEFLQHSFKRDLCCFHCPVVLKPEGTIQSKRLMGSYGHGNAHIDGVAFDLSGRMRHGGTEASSTGGLYYDGGSHPG